MSGSHTRNPLCVQDASPLVLVEDAASLVEVARDEPLAIAGDVCGLAAGEDASDVDPGQIGRGEVREQSDVEVAARQDLREAWKAWPISRPDLDPHLPELLLGALAVADPGVPLWQRATGVLVLLHEAYHLRLWRWRRDEGKVECQAIRHFKVGARLLGDSPELADELLPYALAAHVRMKVLYDYRDDKCKVPLWAPPFVP